MNLQNPENPDLGMIPVRDISQGGHPEPGENIIFGACRTRTFFFSMVAGCLLHPYSDRSVEVHQITFKNMVLRHLYADAPICFRSPAGDLPPREK